MLVNRRAILVLVAVVVLVVVMLVTNPSEETHMKRIRESQPGIIGEGLAIAAEHLGAFDYRNYGVYSTVTSDGERISLGRFGKVWVNQ
jgi:hypothetical protein